LGKLLRLSGNNRRVSGTNCFQQHTFSLLIHRGRQVIRWNRAANQVKDEGKAVLVGQPGHNLKSNKTQSQGLPGVPRLKSGGDGLSTSTCVSAALPGGCVTVHTYLT
jgi:hypothetical protein